MLVFIFDFDDTIVDSTPNIHYKAYKSFCDMTNREPLTLEDYYSALFNKTYVEFIEEMNLTQDEYTLEYENWKNYTSQYKPQAFRDVLRIIKNIQAKGHKIVICSQSNKEAIEDFFSTTDITPDLIISGDREHPENNKPYDYPINLVKEKYGVENSQIYVIDDMKPGLLMAKNNNVKSIGVMYCKYHETLKYEIYNLSTSVADTIEDLEKFINLLI